jgi:hypothetical protein
MDWAVPRLARSPVVAALIGSSVIAGAYRVLTWGDETALYA